MADQPSGRFDPEAILETLHRHGVSYVLIGGYAAQLLGVPLPKTEDLDITPALDPDNLKRLSAALDELGARVRAPDVPEGLPFAHDATSLLAARIWNLVTVHGPMDLAMMPSGTEGYKDLTREASQMTFLRFKVPVASIGDIIRSKEAAGRPKDLKHLPILYQSLRRNKGTRKI